MALSNTLYAALSGLDANQAKLNVVGNNIANANTVAFKGSRVVFRPQFYVTDTGGSQPTEDNGGVNPSQRGLGVTVAGTERNLTQGAIETTGRTTDLAIDGEGYFVVRSDELKYTRDGSFKLNPNSRLVTSSGDYVQGYGIDDNYNIVAGQVVDLTVPVNSLATASATTRASLVGNLKSAGAVASGAAIVRSQALTTLNGTLPAGDTLLTELASASDPATALFTDGEQVTLEAQKGTRDLPAATFDVTAASTLNDLMGFFQSRLGINTTVPDDGNAATPAPGVSFAADAGGTSGRILITSNAGTASAIDIPLAGFTTADGISPLAFAEDPAAPPAVGESVQTGFVVYDSLGTAINVNVTAVLESTATSGTTWRFFAESAGSTDGNLVVGSGTMSFDSLGRLRESTGTNLTISRAGTGAATPLAIELDMTGLTALTSRSSELAMKQQDGVPMGRLDGFSIDETGKIIGSFSNGAVRTLGQIAMATFTNAQGLIDRGSNMFVEGPDSGTAVVGLPGTLGMGKIVSGALELSNVDLSEEFINMIIASTGFSASSRVITTSDQLLTELLNSSR